MNGMVTNYACSGLYPVSSHAFLITSFFIRYSSTTGLGTVFSGQEKLTHLEQKKILRVETKEVLVIRLAIVIPISPKSEIMPYSA